MQIGFLKAEKNSLMIDPNPFYISISSDFRMADSRIEEASRSRQRWLPLQGATLGFPYKILTDP